jgi:hypothetical protein
MFLEGIQNRFDCYSDTEQIIAELESLYDKYKTQARNVRPIMLDATTLASFDKLQEVFRTPDVSVVIYRTGTHAYLKCFVGAVMSPSFGLIMCSDSFAELAGYSRPVEIGTYVFLGYW